MELAGRESENDMTVLYVDDDPDDRFFFEEAIEQLKIPCRLLMADSCMAMKTIIEDAHIDIIFLDINMPGQDGKACLREVKSNNEWSKIPVVILTGTYNKPDADEVYSLGANLYVIKPVVHRDFVSMMQSLFSYDWQKDPKPRFRKFVIEHMSDVGT